MFRRWRWRWLWLWLFSSFVLRLFKFSSSKFQTRGAIGFFTLHSSLFVLQSYEESLTQIPVMIHLRALMIHLWYSYVQLRAIRCTYEGCQLLKWRGNPVGMPMRRCKNDGEKMQKCYFTKDEKRKTKNVIVIVIVIVKIPSMLLA